jgi:hypothetical protein
MPEEILNNNESTRSRFDFFCFALVSLGIVVALTGVAITSIRVVLLGLVLVGWGYVHFYREPDLID